MIDDLSDVGDGQTEEQVEFARAYLADGPMDPVIVARIQDPAAAAERAQAKVAMMARDWAGLGHYRKANAAVAGKPVRGVFMGDSITEMWAVAQPDLFADGVINRGVSGQTSPQILLRFMADAVALKPGWVHLMCGLNDIAGNTGPTTPQAYCDNITAMVDLAEANGIAVILGSVTPADRFIWSPQIIGVADRVAELNGWLADLAGARSLVFCDYHTALTTPEGALRPELTRDGVHPTGAGYRAMRPLCDDAIARVQRD